MSDDWVAETTKRIGKAIQDLRGKRSGQWLSDRTAELGHRVSRSTISEIETYRRKTITVTDLILLAAALNTAPVALVFPGPYDRDTKLVPREGQSWDETWAVQWFSGLLDGSTMVSLSDDVGEYDRNMARLRLAREVWELDEAKWGLLKQIQESDNSDDQQRKITDEQRHAIYMEAGRIQKRVSELMNTELWRGSGR